MAESISFPVALSVMCSSDQLRHGLDAVSLTPLFELAEDPPGCPGICERRRADLDRRCPGEQELYDIGSARRAPTPTIGRSGSASCTSKTARTATGCIAAPDNPPFFAPSTGRRDSVSITMPSKVFVSTTASAPARWAASAISGRSAAFGLSLAHIGRPTTVDASMTSAVAVRLWANIEPRSSRFGHDTLTSTATTPSGAAASAAAARA